MLLKTTALTLLLILGVLAQDCYISPEAVAYPIESTYSCAAGFYCPNTTSSNPQSLPQICPATLECQADRLGGKFCSPQGTYEPQPCPKGYYCPTYLDRIDCPEGYFCTIGSFEPKKCELMSYCPKNSSNQLYYGSVVITAIVDGAIGLAYLFYSLYLKRKNAKAHKEATSLAKIGNALQPSNFDFRFENLSFKLKEKQILCGVSGTIKHGRVTAIMGPSGSGKTTFLNVLMGKVPHGGRLYINGKEGQMYKYKKMIGFVPQDDIMLRELTVRENISFSARVRLPQKWETHKKVELVDSVISSLSLNLVQNTVVGDELKRGVSGGQRKRVNIGIELAAAPSALFLDEPTSGLDSTQALHVANIMKQLAHTGMNVVAVIHQPRYEIFNTFDDILLLCPGGKVAYMGTGEEIEKYFHSLGYEFESKENPADVLMDIVSGNKKTKDGKLVDIPKAWIERNPVSKSIEQFEIVTDDGKASSAEPEQNRWFDDLANAASLKNQGANFFVQICLNHNRSLVQQYRTFNSFLLEVGVSGFAGLLMGLSVMGNAGALYAGVLVAPYSLISPSPFEFVLPMFGLLIGLSVGLAGAPAGVKTFGEERVIYWREAAAGHSKVAYYLGKMIATIYRILVTSLHFSTLFYVLGRPLISFGKLYAIIFLMFFCVYGLASVVSMVVRRENSALLAVIVCLFAGVFNGFGPTLVSAKQWKIEFLWELSYGRWATEALFSEELLPHRHFYQIDEISAPQWGYTLDRYAMDVGLMFVLGVTYRIVALVLMLLINRRKTK